MGETPIPAVPKPPDNNRVDPEPENSRIIAEQTGKNQTLAD